MLHILEPAAGFRSCWEGVGLSLLLSSAALHVDWETVKWMGKRWVKKEKRIRVRFPLNSPKSKCGGMAMSCQRRKSESLLIKD